MRFQQTVSRVPVAGPAPRSEAAASGRVDARSRIVREVWSWSGSKVAPSCPAPPGVRAGPRAASPAGAGRAPGAAPPGIRELTLDSPGTRSQARSPHALQRVLSLPGRGVEKSSPDAGLGPGVPRTPACPGCPQGGRRPAAFLLQVPASCTGHREAGRTAAPFGSRGLSSAGLALSENPNGRLHPAPTPGLPQGRWPPGPRPHRPSSLPLTCLLLATSTRWGSGWPWAGAPGVPGMGRAWLLEFRELESDFQPPDLKQQRVGTQVLDRAQRPPQRCGLPVGPRAQPGGSGVVLTAPENFGRLKLDHPGVG